MKTIKIILSILLLSLFTITTYAQRTVVKVYPKHGVVVKKIKNPRVVVHKGINYSFASGVWYKQKGNRFIVAKPPVGIRVKTLPSGYKLVKVRGRKYYAYKGVYYKKRGRKYIVVTV